MRPGGGEPDTPGWIDAGRAEPLPGAAAGDAAPDGGDVGGGRRLRQRRRPAAGLAAGGRTGPLRRAAGDRGARGVINAPQHATALAELSDEQVAAAVETWRERMRAHSDAAYVQLIVNEGGGAGASLEHTHAQLYALPFVPVAVARERERAGAYRERTAGGGLLSDVLVEEVRRGERLVAIDDEAALICPWASRSPFELRIVPRAESPSFAEDTTGAAMLATAHAAPGRALGRPAGPQPLGAHRAARRAGGLPLAHRHRAAARRSRPASSSAPASTSTPTRPSAPRPTCARRCGE